MSLDLTNNILLSQYHWIYPSTQSEFVLFNSLFDDKEKRKEIIDKYSYIFNKQTIGIAIRRGCTVNNDKYKTLSINDIICMIDSLNKKYYNLNNIFITSDDIKFIVDSNIQNMFSNIFINQCKSVEDTIRILSMCDLILNNGNYYYSITYIDENNKLYMESTFGQIAQLLNKSYKYI